MLVRWIRSRTCILYVAVEPAVGPLILNANPDPNANADPYWNSKCRSVKKFWLRIRTYIPNTDPVQKETMPKQILDLLQVTC
jgi:hypothetical protein